MVQDTIQDIFDSFLNQQPLFTNKNTLQEAYTPGTLPHRGEQIKQLASILVPSLRGEKPSNVFIYGKTGTGKTLVSKYVGLELEKKAASTRTRLKTLYLNCKMEKINTSYRILAHFLNQLNTQVPATGLPTDEIYKKFIKTIDSIGGAFILILDEIDALTETNILYDLTRVNTELSRAKISIVGISNSLNFTNSLDPRIKSSLSEEELVFPPYNAPELQDILSRRAVLALNSGVLQEGVIAKCAALAAQEHGDARRALDLLRVSVEIAERRGEASVTLNHVDFAQKKLDIDRVVETIQKLPRHSQLILQAVLELQDRQKGEIDTGEVYTLYTSYCKRLKTDPLTQRRISDIISELDMLGLIDAIVISKGRYGRTRKIKIEMPEVALEKSRGILTAEFL